MTQLNELKARIDAFVAAAREQDRTICLFFDYLTGLGPDVLLGFEADALPEVAPSKSVIRLTPIGVPIRG